MNTRKRLAIAFALALCLLLAASTAFAALLELPASLTRIEEEAFYGTVTADEVVVPEGVTYIGPRAFAQSAFRVITLPESANELSEDAFDGCENALYRVVYGSPAHAFVKTEGLRYELVIDQEETPAWKINVDENGKIVSFNGDGTDTVLVIPEVVNGIRVTGVKKNAFYDMRQSLYAVVLPEGVTTLDDGAFSGLSKLEYVRLPSTLKTIGEYTFQYCGFSTLTLPEGLESIGTFAFALSDLQQITIPASVTAMGDQPFSQCSSLQRIDVAEDSRHFSSVEGMLTSKAGDRLWCIPAGMGGTVTIPASVRTIATGAAIYTHKITELIIPETVETIENFAIAVNVNLERVQLDKEILSIGTSNFSTCSKLTAYVQKHSPAHVFCESEKVRYEFYADETLDGWTYHIADSGAVITGYSGSDRFVVVPKQIEGSPVAEVGNGTFDGTSAAQTVVIPEGVTALGRYGAAEDENGELMILPGAFEKSSVHTVHLPASLNTIGEYALGGTNLQTITVADGGAFSMDASSGVLLTADGTEIVRMLARTTGDYTVPASVSVIRPTAFDHCTGLSSITLHSGISSIGSAAFAHCTGLSSIALPEGLTALETSLLRYCSNLETVTLPSALTEIGMAVFEGCTKLSGVVLPETLERIDGGAFRKCPALKEMTIPGTVKSIGVSAFDQTDITLTVISGSYAHNWCVENDVPFVAVHGPTDEKYFTVETNAEGTACTITGYTGLDEVVVIPETIGGARVVALGNTAFNTDVVKELRLPSLLSDISADAFLGADSLETITVHVDNTSFKEADGVLLSYDGTTLVKYPSGRTSASYTVPAGVTVIADNAFNGAKSLAQITFPDEVKIIGSYAFAGCGLTEVTVPEGAGGLGSHAFANNTSLTKAVLPSTITSFPYAFAGCEALTDVTLTDGIPALSAGAFSGCASLETLALPKSITSIDRSAFDGCDHLTLLVPWVSHGYDWAVENSFPYELLPNPASDFRFGSHYENTMIVEAYLGSDPRVYVPGTVDGWTVIAVRDGTFSGDNLEAVILGEGVDTIGQNTFRNFQNLTSVSLPSTLTYIGDYAFSGTPLAQISLPEGLETIERYAFQGCQNLTSVTLPSTLTAIGERAFSETAIAQISLPDGIQSIGDYAFSYTPLTSFTLPATLKTVPNALLAGCEELTSVTFGGSETTIGSSAFGGCTSLAQISVPATVKTIEAGAFGGTGLTQITLPEGVETLGNAVFSKCEQLGTVVLPNSLTTMGDDAFRSCGRLTSVTLGEGLTAIPQDAFYYCDHLREIEIPGNVKSIGLRAFSSTALDAIILNEGLETIGQNAFANTCLTSLHIPASVTSIGLRFVYNVPTLEELTVAAESQSYAAADNVLFSKDGKKLIFAIPRSGEYIVPDGVESIEQMAFYLHTALKHVVVPEGVTAIGDSAFFTCNALEMIELPDSLTYIDVTAFDSATGTALVTAESYAHNWCKTNRYQFKLRPTPAEYFTCTTSGSNALITGYSGTQYPHVVIPETIGDYTVTGIRGEAMLYDHPEVTAVTLNEGLLNVAAYAFVESPSLAEVHLSSTVNTIGDDAFTACPALKTFTVAEGSDAFKVDSRGALLTADGTKLMRMPTLFRGSYSVPSTVKTIAPSAFDGCTGLTSVTLPEGLTAIGDYAFAGCTGLTSLALPSTITEVGVSITSGCTGLAAINVAQGSTAVTSHEGVLFTADLSELILCPMGKTGVYTLPAQTRTIRDSAFAKCAGLTAINLNEGLRTIGTTAFTNCRGLTEITIPASVDEIDTSNYGGAFDQCVNLTAIHVTSGNEIYSSIGGALLSDDGTLLYTVPAGLTGTYTVPESVSTVCGSAFNAYGTQGFTEIDFGRAVTIQPHAVTDHEILSHVVLPYTLNSIQQNAFFGCSEFTASVALDSYAHTWCVNNGISCETEIIVTPEHHFTFAINPYDSTACTLDLYVGPYTNVIIPETLQGWRVTAIAEGTFANGSHIVSITVPSSVTDIADGAFDGAPGAVLKVSAGSYAHTWCMDNGVHYELEATNESAFTTSVNADGTVSVTGCSAADETIVIPSSIEGAQVTAIADGAFSGNTTATSICLPDSVIRVGSDAFDGCSALRAIEVSENHPSFCTVDGMLMDAEGTTLLRVPEGLNGTQAEE